MLTKEYVVSFDTYLNEGFGPGKSKSKKSMKDVEEDEDEDDSEDDEDEDTNESLNYIVDEFANECETIVESTVNKINRIHTDFVNENEYEFSTLSESNILTIKPLLEMALRANTIEELEEVSESIEEYSELNEEDGFTGTPSSDTTGKTGKKENWFKKIGKMVADKTKAMKESLKKLTTKKKESEASVKDSNASPEQKKSKLKKIGEWFKKSWDAIKAGATKAINAIKNKFKKKK